MKKFLSKKYYWLPVLILSGMGLWWFFGNSTSTIPVGVETGAVQRGQVVEVVSETGSVEAAQSVQLAFTAGGRVTDIFASEGSEVKAGEAMITLDTAAADADLSAAYARLAAESARLEELRRGADADSLAVSESSVNSAKTAFSNAEKNLAEVIAQQDQLVANAKKTLLTSSLQAYLVSDERENTSHSYLPPTVSGTYDGETEGVYHIELYRSEAGSGYSYRISGLETGVEPVSTVSPAPLGAHGLFVQFPNNFAPNTKWEVPIPNTRAASYVATLNAYNSAIDRRAVAISNAESASEAAKDALLQGETQLNQVASSAREEKITAQKAAVSQARAAIKSAQVRYNNLTLTAPFAGLVTKVNPEVGEIVGATAPAMSLISKDQYELTVGISEVDIADMSVGDPATVTFDAYDDEEFSAQVQRIAPSAKLVDGIRVFKVTLTFTNPNNRIKAGLSADIDITTAVRESVLAVPTRAIYEDEQGKFVRVIKDNKVVAVRVETGLRGSNGKSEIVSGLTGGETIITFASEDDIAQLEK